LALGFFALVAALAMIADAKAHPFPNCRETNGYGAPAVVYDGPGPMPADLGGTWYWLRSPDEEKRVITGIFNRYCIRCHGVDGRGVWDIPGVPNFTNVRWQASRSDEQLVRIILEGRGAVMPPFRGALSLEEAWAMARYLRTLIPGAETPKPDFDKPEKPGDAKPKPEVKPEVKPPAPAKEKNGAETKRSDSKQILVLPAR